MKRTFLLSIISLILIKGAWAESVVFPVRHELPALHLPFPSPHNFSREENSWELSRLIYHYTQLRRIPGYYHPPALRDTFLRNNLTAWNRFGEGDLRRVAKGIHAKNILLSKLTHSDGKYHLSTALYSDSSGKVSNVIQTSDSSIMSAIRKNLDIRYPGSPFLYNFSAVPSVQYLLLLDSSGAGYYESVDYRKKISSLAADKLAVCAVKNGENNIFYPFADIQIQTGKLTSLRYSGSSLNAESWQKMKNCADSALSGNPKTPVILYHNGGLENSTAKGTFSRMISDLARRHSIYILGISGIDNPSRKYLDSLASGNKNIFYYDNIAWERAANPDGSSLYLMLRNYRLYQAQSLEWDKSAPSVSIPERLYRRNCSLVCLHEELHGIKLIETGDKGYSSDLFYRHLNSVQEKSSNRIQIGEEQNVRLLVRTENIAFWIQVPYREYLAARSEQSRSYYFMISLTGENISSQNINHRGYGKVFSNRNDIPALLEISMPDYFQNPESYLHKSLHGGSFYVFGGEILEIRLDERNKTRDWEY